MQILIFGIDTIIVLRNKNKFSTNINNLFIDLTSEKFIKKLNILKN